MMRDRAHGYLGLTFSDSAPSISNDTGLETYLDERVPGCRSKGDEDAISIRYVIQSKDETREQATS